MASRVTGEILEGLGKLPVSHMGVESADDRADAGIGFELRERKWFEGAVLRILATEV